VLPASLVGFQGVAAEKNKMVMVMVMVMVNVEFAVEELGFAAGAGKVIVDMHVLGRCWSID